MTIQHLELTFAATRFTPETTLFYRSEGPTGEVNEARVTVGGKAAMKHGRSGHLRTSTPLPSEASQPRGTPGR